VKKIQRKIRPESEGTAICHDAVKIDDLLGLPYKKAARGPNAWDCYGLCMEVCRRAGIVLPDIQTPTTRPDRNHLFTTTKDIWIKLAKPEPWCVAAFQIRRNWHAGVVIADCQRFIHVTAGINVTVSQLYHHKWRRRCDGFYLPDHQNIESV
jgi:cell wall-associated NlpC family hydrolase